MYYNDNTIVFLDGQWLKANDAKGSLFSQTLHYGSGVFEGIRSYDANGEAMIFKAEEHYERLLYSARKMHIKCDYSVEELTNHSYELLRKNDLKNAYIRPLLYLGENMTLHTVDKVHLMLCGWEWGKYLGDSLLNVMVSSYERPNPKAVPVEAKVTGHYTNSILATTEAKAKGFDEALLLDRNGSVAEGSGANFFFEKEGVLYTPPLGNILPGITRLTAMDIAGEMGIEVREEYFPPEVVKGADGAFFTGTAAEIAGIGYLDGSPFKLDWKDTIGYKISERYKELVRKPSNKRQLTELKWN
ncbi:branched-chain amino acid transaminase [Roseivirga sp. E12]|uniref:branched-chain amino acid transaminase n=1 Tax=Roseivirga sp. E12 TaxID=2819237 RepID=UPI001ABD4499|nr:branched-chain amino acid transaminase [Roseivirga sp. E12]MBO3697100.1 branched-chain amino acid transaminase [Roseivirga sp. E12]